MIMNHGAKRRARFIGGCESRRRFRLFFLENSLVCVAHCVVDWMELDQLLGRYRSACARMLLAVTVRIKSPTPRRA